MTQSTRMKLTSVSAALTLTACGGGGGGGGGSDPADGRTGPPRAAEYQTIDSTANVRSTLGGTVLRTRSDNDDSEIVATRGGIQHNTGALTLRDDLYVFIDDNGPDANGVFRDDNFAELDTAINDGVATGDYEYVTLYDGDYGTNGFDYTLLGSAGIVTRSRDVPSVGSARYTGDAFAAVARPRANNTVDAVALLGGRSVVDADFANGTVDVTLDDFDQIIDGNTGQSRTAPLDRITIRDMTIAGTGYSGGTITTLNDGAAVNLVGGVTDEDAAGTFFGYDDDILAPDETAGQVFQTGPDGAVVGGFIAD